MAILYLYLSSLSFLTYAPAGIAQTAVAAHHNTLLHNVQPFAPDSVIIEHGMKTLTEIKQILQAQKPYLAERYGVVEIGVFGSYVRDEQRPDSDLDILIELERPPRISLIGLVELEHYLSDILGTKVDIAIKKNLRKRIGKRILKEVVPV